VYYDYMSLLNTAVIPACAGMTMFRNGFYLAQQSIIHYDLKNSRNFSKRKPPPKKPLHCL
jgi:hypothetical protein